SPTAPARPCPNRRARCRPPRAPSSPPLVRAVSKILHACRKHTQQRVCAAFEELGSNSLKPVFERLDGSVSYDELTLLRVCYLCGKKLVFTAVDDI
ncbi:MAG: helix-turn-helix domain-containing protein, partial [Pirellulaceae bacterium]